ncbi:hypothetical protein A6P39_012180 [Streptomyces sp. FXJ1.172]|uniref:hypothetical protein n=1 Tax=Streptomyces sp. FXJ1.172 TaxID=710705 RepID=UPI0007CF7BE6|nr:hypothetical protein [Streptomyces sp. FXJ1.172]WEO94701.1 hypothetical protein A6P39_012180 [Streptomyces sp. FXJ1.172]
MRKVLPLALTSVIAVSACQFADGHDTAGEAHRLNAMAALPLHAYLPDPASADGKAVSRAQWILAKKCMVRLGFAGFAVLDTKNVESTYPVRPGTLDLASTLGDDSPYGVDDPGLASEHGYHNRNTEDSAQSQEWPADQFVALTGEFESGDSRLAHGNRIPEGGCLGQATRTIYGAPPRAMKVGGVKLSGYYSLAMELWYQSHKDARKDPAWKKADRTWSDCMKKKGFHYADPDKASVDFAWFKTRQPSDKEKSTAAADARCKLDTGYIPAAHSLDERNQKAAIARNRQKLDDLRAAEQRAVRNARTIVAKES